VLSIGDVSILICHGSPNSLVDEYFFPSPVTFKDVLKKYSVKAKTNIVILRHTHIPFIQRFSEGYVINPGSVGQPRSEDPRASYILMTVENSEADLKHRLVEYKFRKVADRIVEVGLPSFLAERLYFGI
jgi:predicted phosphodiesterase